MSKIARIGSTGTVLSEAARSSTMAIGCAEEEAGIAHH